MILTPIGEAQPGGRPTSNYSWSGGFIIYTLLMLTLAAQKLRRSIEPQNHQSITVESEPKDEISGSQALIWLLLPAFASALLIATTNRIGLDVPAAPFL